MQLLEKMEGLLIGDVIALAANLQYDSRHAEINKASTDEKESLGKYAETYLTVLKTASKEAQELIRVIFFDYHD
jgi:hypothetical protein